MQTLLLQGREAVSDRMGTPVNQNKMNYGKKIDISTVMHKNKIHGPKQNFDQIHICLFFSIVRNRKLHLYSMYTVEWGGLWVSEKVTEVKTSQMCWINDLLVFYCLFH